MLNRTRLAYRIGRRSLARHRSRSLAMIVLLALPLTVAVALSVVISSAQVPPERIPYLRTGQSALTLTFAKADTSHHARQQYQTQLDRLAGAGITTAQATAQVAFRQPVIVADKLVTGVFYGADNWQRPEFGGRFDLTDGRLPLSNTAEVALSRAALTALHISIGAQVDLGGTGKQTVVGQLLDPRDTNRIWGVAGLEALLTADESRSVELRAGSPAIFTWFSTQQLPQAALVAAGWQITDRSQQSGYAQDPILASVVPIVGPILALVLAFVALLTGAGFALGAAELRTEIGLLQVAGAGRGLIRSALGAQGVICALVALGAATLAGISLAWAGLGPLSRAFAQIWASTPRIDLWQLAIIWAVGVLVIGGASLLATRSVARLTISQALHPDPPLALLPRPSRLARVVAVSCAIVLIVTLVLLAITKATALILFAALVAFAGILAVRQVTASALGMLYRRFGVAGRIVGRSAAFAPGRLAGQIAAIMAVVLVSGLVLTIYAGLTAKVTRNILPRLPEGAAMVNGVKMMPESLIVDLQQYLDAPSPIPIDYAAIPAADGQLVGAIFLDTIGRRCLQLAEPCANRYALTDTQPVGMVSDSGLRRIIGRELTANERAVWDTGGVLVTSADFLFDGQLALREDQSPQLRGQVDMASIPVAVVVGQVLYSGSELPNAFVRAQQAGPFVTARQTMWYFPPGPGPKPISDTAKAVADKMIVEVQDGAFLTVQRPAPAIAAMRMITIIVSGVLVLLVTIVCATTASMCLRDMAVEWTVLRRMGAPQALIRRCALILGLVPGVVASLFGIAVIALIAPWALRAYDAPFAWATFGIFLGGLVLALGLTILGSRYLVTARRLTAGVSPPRR